MSISKSYNKQNGVTYVYEVIENYWDKEKKRPQSKRKLIGKIDPKTGEIVPTSRRRKKTVEDAGDYRKLYEESEKNLALKEERISELRNDLKEILNDELSFLSEIELEIAKRKKSVEDLLHRYKKLWLK